MGYLSLFWGLFYAKPLFTSRIYPDLHFIQLNLLIHPAELPWSRGRRSGRPVWPAKIYPDRAEPADFHPDPDADPCFRELKKIFRKNRNKRRSGDRNYHGPLQRPAARTNGSLQGMFWGGHDGPNRKNPTR